MHMYSDTKALSPSLPFSLSGCCGVMEELRTNVKCVGAPNEEIPVKI